MASSGRRMATDGSGRQHEENKGFADNSALKEEHDQKPGVDSVFGHWEGSSTAIRKFSTKYEEKK